MVVQLLKYFIIYCLRIILQIFYIFPINERKIIFNSYKGKQYSCNPKYIFEFLYENYGNKYIFIWCIDNKNKLPERIKCLKTVKYLSLQYCYNLLTAKYYIFNDGINPVFPIRQKQIVINTWHGGGAYKYTGIKSYTNNPELLKKVWILRAKMTRYIISSCRAFTKYTSNDFLCEESKYMPIGMPRNDLFFDKIKYESAREKIYKYFNISNEDRIVLYAPTYRSNKEMFDYKAIDDLSSSIFAKEILNILNEKFGYNYLFLMRNHYVYYSLDNNYLSGNGIIPASAYPDMQELLCAADVLITDYSSSIWDFSLTFKPCFIYAPDIKTYLEKQGFYTPITEWPFPIAQTNEELIRNIIQFDKKNYVQAVKKHHVDLESYENGTATKQFCEKMFL